MSQQPFKLRRTMSGENQPVPELPRDMIFEIMRGLPPPSLLRFSTVSRSWQRIVTSPYFKRQHLAKAISSGDDYVISLYTDFIDNKAFNLLSDETCAHVSDLRIPENARPLKSAIVGSSNGLLCLTDVENPGRTVRICNPAIGMYRDILSTSFHIPLNIFNPHGIQLGFGYHAETNDYKIVRIAFNPHQEMVEPMFNGVDEALLQNNELGLNDVGHPVEVDGVEEDSDEEDSDEEDSDEEFVISDDEELVDDDFVNENQVLDFANRTLVEVFSLRENAWKKIENIETFPWQILELTSGIVVNNSVHWIASHSYPVVDAMVILAFDLGSHTFREIDIPPDHRIAADTRECLGVLDGCLAFVDLSLNKFWGNTTCRVWVLREYGVVQSWTVCATCLIKADIERPRFFTKGRRLVFEGAKGELVVYNLVNHEIQTRAMDDHIRFFTFAPYTQTMVWFGND